MVVAAGQADFDQILVTPLPLAPRTRSRSVAAAPAGRTPRRRQVRWAPTDRTRCLTRSRRRAAVGAADLWFPPDRQADPGAPAVGALVRQPQRSRGAAPTQRAKGTTADLVPLHRAKIRAEAEVALEALAQMVDRVVAVLAVLARRTTSPARLSPTQRAAVAEQTLRRAEAQVEVAG